MCDPHKRLIRLLAEQAGPGAVLAAAERAPWRSVTFTGERHRLLFEGDGAAVRRLRAVAGEALRIPGHIVAELDVAEECGESGALRIAVTALTLEGA